MSNYYCLMAGAPDLKVGDATPAMSVEAFREECESQLSRKDKTILERFFYAEMDCLNLATLLEDAEAPLTQTGNRSREELLSLIEEVRSEEKPQRGLLADLVRRYDAEAGNEGFFVRDAALYAFLQDAIAHCPNGVIRQWHGLLLNINNVLTALLAKRYGWNASDRIMGEGAVQTQIRESSDADFGLGDDLEYMPQLLEIARQDDPVEKERMMDALKWTWLQDATFFTPFALESVFAYLCQLSILERWAKLDPEQGKARFEEIIENLRGEARVPEEFVRK